MNVTILLDHDIEGLVVFIEVGLMETGWAQDLNIQFKRLRDANLAEDSTDQEIWRFKACPLASQSGRPTCRAEFGRQFGGLGTT